MAVDPLLTQISDSLQLPVSLGWTLLSPAWMNSPEGADQSEEKAFQDTCCSLELRLPGCWDVSAGVRLFP